MESKVNFKCMVQSKIARKILFVIFVSMNSFVASEYKSYFSFENQSFKILPVTNLNRYFLTRATIFPKTHAHRMPAENKSNLTQNIIDISLQTFLDLIDLDIYKTNYNIFVLNYPSSKFFFHILQNATEIDYTNATAFSYKSNSTKFILRILDEVSSYLYSKEGSYPFFESKSSIYWPPYSVNNSLSLIRRLDKLRYIYTKLKLSGQIFFESLDIKSARKSASIEFIF